LTVQRELLDVERLNPDPRCFMSRMLPQPSRSGRAIRPVILRSLLNASLMFAYDPRPTRGSRDAHTHRETGCGLPQ
jgi:hypothetical protein